MFAGFLGLSAATGSGELIVPLLATQILWINLVTDSAPALAMGVDPEIDDVMARAPRRPEDRIMDRAMWARIMFIGLVMGAATLLTIDMFRPAASSRAPTRSRSPAPRASRPSCSRSCSTR